MDYKDNSSVLLCYRGNQGFAYPVPNVSIITLGQEVERLQRLKL